jgi:hexosaminidase
VGFASVPCRKLQPLLRPTSPTGFTVCEDRTQAIYKQSDCVDVKKRQAGCDLFLLNYQPVHETVAPRDVTRKADFPPGNFPPIWPRPASFTSGSGARPVSTGFKFPDRQNAPSTLAKAYDRYHRLAFAHHPDDVAPEDADAVEVVVIDNDESHPQLETDERYELEIPVQGDIRITALTIYGALHALETLSQLVKYDFSAKTYTIDHVPWKISDAPRFPHRGVMLDTARHFLSIATIRGVIASLPFAKLNVLHWHMTDTQSFPMESKTSPKLWDGSWSQEEKYLQVEIASVVEYARLRGVRVMVEFDTPGHASSWCQGYPEICPSASCGSPLNVANNATFDLISGLLGECTGGNASRKGAPSGLFPGNLIHLGGDEVDMQCWKNTPAIWAWLESQGMSLEDGYGHFVKRVAAVAIAQGRSPVYWEEVFENFKATLDKRTIVHVWKTKGMLKEVVQAGFRAIFNQEHKWYLDWSSTTWEDMYSEEPCAELSSKAECSLVLGGQGNLWGEEVDASDLEPTLWPRTAGIAEKLWSPQGHTQHATAQTPRMNGFRCLLHQRGVGASVVAKAATGKRKQNVKVESPTEPFSCYASMRELRYEFSHV